MTAAIHINSVLRFVPGCGVCACALRYVPTACLASRAGCRVCACACAFFFFVFVLLSGEQQPRPDVAGALLPAAQGVGRARHGRRSTPRAPQARKKRRNSSALSVANKSGRGLALAARIDAGQNVPFCFGILASWHFKIVVDKKNGGVGGWTPRSRAFVDVVSLAGRFGCTSGTLLFVPTYVSMYVPFFCGSKCLHRFYGNKIMRDKSMYGNG